jgi:serine protease Do
MARWSIALVLLVIGGLAGSLVSSSGLQGQQAVSPAVVPKELTSYRDVVKQVLPAVVSVESKPKVTKTKQRSSSPRQRPRIDGIPGLPEEFRKFFEEMPDSPFGIDPAETLPQHSFGSGFIIDPKGVILTNFHVVDGTDRVEVTLKDGRKFASTDIRGDRKNDLAIVRIDAKTPLPYLQLGDSDAMEIGDRVLAMGAPFGLTGSVTAGIVSAKGRNGLTPGRSVYEDYLQTDAAINPGNSGGPLVSLDGKVIGINTAIRSRSGGFQGVGLAIASNVAKSIVDQLIKEGVVHRGYLGVKIGELKPDVAEKLGVTEKSGVFVSQVFEGAPADKAGIQEGDVISAVAGKSITDARELQRLVGSLPLHKPVDVTITRDGKAKTLKVTIEEQPETYGLASGQSGSPRSPKGDKEDMSVEKLGIDFTELTPETASRYGFREGAKGVVITDIEPGSLASEAGLRRGMLITKIDKKAVSSASTARDMLEKVGLDKGVLLQVQLPPNLGGGTALYVLKAEAAGK